MLHVVKHTHIQTFKYKKHTHTQIHTDANWPIETHTENTNQIQAAETSIHIYAFVFIGQ